jgi:lauroyl/myristoyl acyltransferase
LQAGHAVGIAMDEFKHGKVVAPVFKGQLPAESNIRYAINLARRFNAPLVTGYCLRRDAVKFDITCADVIYLDDQRYAGKTDAEIGSIINEQCKQWVMKYPEQWYMLHRARLTE